MIYNITKLINSLFIKSVEHSRRGIIIELPYIIIELKIK